MTFPLFPDGSSRQWQDIERRCADKPGFLGHVISHQQARSLGLSEVKTAQLRLCLLPQNAAEWEATARYFGIEGQIKELHDPRKVS